MDQPPEHEITHLLTHWRSGDEDVERRLMELIYPDLRRIASRRLGADGHDLSMQTTDLVHEAYLRLAPQKGVCWQNRVHFFSVAARVVRRVLVDQIRLKGRQKRQGGVRVCLDWEEETPNIPCNYPNWLELDDALEKLTARVDAGSGDA